MLIPDSVWPIAFDGEDDPENGEMAYEKPKLSLNQAGKAGKRLLDPSLSDEEFTDAIQALWDWRSAQGFPLNSLYMTLRNRALSVDPKAVTAQRLKRYASIIRKLLRRSTMQMSQMQDIGGCRAVVSNMRQLQELRNLYATRPLRHDARPPIDYIASPKDDGYRGIHLLYRFCGKGATLPWDRLRIEIQLRTALQHSWSTAVETVDAFTGQNMKFGGGTADWRRFFVLMGSVHAGMEKSAPVPNTPENRAELLEEVQHLAHKLNVLPSLRSFALAAQHITGGNLSAGGWYVIEMRPEESSVLIDAYPTKNFKEAKEQAGDLEERSEGTSKQVVLVSARNLKELKKAYPNYFADTHNFAKSVEKFLA